MHTPKLLCTRKNCCRPHRQPQEAILQVCLRRKSEKVTIWIPKTVQSKTIDQVQFNHNTTVHFDILHQKLHTNLLFATKSPYSIHIVVYMYWPSSDLTPKQPQIYVLAFTSNTKTLEQRNNIHKEDMHNNLEALLELESPLPTIRKLQ